MQLPLPARSQGSQSAPLITESKAPVPGFGHSLPWVELGIIYSQNRLCLCRKGEKERREQRESPSRFRLGQLGLSDLM